MSHLMVEFDLAAVELTLTAFSLASGATHGLCDDTGTLLRGQKGTGRYSQRVRVGSFWLVAWSDKDEFPWLQEAARLLERSQQSALNSLYEVGRALNSSLQLEKVLGKVLDQSLTLLGAEQGSLLMVDEVRSELTLLESQAGQETTVATTSVDVEEDLTAWVEEQTRHKNLPAAAMRIPLRNRRRVVGVLTLRGGRDFNSQDEMLLGILGAQAASAIANAQLYDAAIRALANAVDARDRYTSGHSERVMLLATAMAERMGFSLEALEDLRWASLLHDIGKIRIRDHILHKPGKLTDEEYDEMKRHPGYGVEILHPVHAFHHVLPFVLHHHERWDGGGYPRGLKGEEIPLQARLMCVADCFDAMTSDRPYRSKMTVEKALEEVRVNAGSQFDPEVVRVFLELAAEGMISPIVERQKPL